MQQYTWIYSLEAPLSPSLSETLRQDFQHFLQQWKSHGTPVSGSILIKYDRFVVLQADMGTDRPSGCSIDSMRKAVEGILHKHQLATLPANYVFYLLGDNTLAHADFRSLPELLAAGILTPETTVFDHSLNQSDDLTLWERPLKDTWMKRYVGAESAFG